MTSPRTPDDPRGDELRQHAADEHAARLRHSGVRLSGSETQEELVELLEAVENFERAVIRRGGDLMVDEPIANRSRPSQPDNAAFALPTRRDDESSTAYIERLGEATSRARQQPPL